MRVLPTSLSRGGKEYKVDSSREELIADIRRVAEAFVRQHYGDEERFFPVVWEAFEEWFKKLKGSESVRLASETLHADVQVGLGFTRHEVVDLVTPIVLATVAETLRGLREKRLSLSEAGVFVGKTASEFGAAPALTAEMVRYLPGLCRAVRTVDASASTAHVSVASRPQYQIWTEGKQATVSDVSQYEARKASYLLWVDMDEKPHVSIRNPGEKIGPEAVDLLLCMVKRLGKRVTFEQVLDDVWREEPRTEADLKRSQENKVEQQLTALDRFCKGGFREFLFGEKFAKGLGLKESFSDKYFIFSRLR